MASHFSPLRIEKIGARRWLLTDDLIYESVLLRGSFVIPRGFQTDLASIPRIAYALFPPVDLYDPAAVLHDAGYAHALLTVKGDVVHLVKPWADRMFLEGMLDLGVPPWKAHTMHRLVHLFGDPKVHPLFASMREVAA